jgi:hypothetical protein
VYWIAALVASTPFVLRGLPSGVVFGLCGSGVSAPAYTSRLQYDAASVRNPGRFPACSDDNANTRFRDLQVNVV